MVLAVNAETSPDVLEYRSDHIPVFSKASSAMVDLPINRYSFDTVTLLRQGLENARLKLRATKRAPDSPLSPDAEVYFINASLSEVDDPDEREALDENSNHDVSHGPADRPPSPGRIAADP